MKKFLITCLMALLCLLQVAAADNNTTQDARSAMIADMQAEITWDKAKKTFIVNDRPISEKEYLQFAEMNSTAAFKMYKTKKSQKAAGATFLSIGVVAMVGGATCWGLGQLTLNNYKKYDPSLPQVSIFKDYQLYDDWDSYPSDCCHTCDALYWAGVGLVAGGAFFTTVFGIPLYCSGNHYQQKSLGVYNKARTFQYSLELKPATNGVGLCLKF